MYRLKTTSLTDYSFLHEANNPSFSSTLLDQIYRSIDEAERKQTGEMRETSLKKQNKVGEKMGRHHQQAESDKRVLRHHHDQEALFLSSTSSSSDSSFSSSDTEYGVRSRARASCFAHARPKPVLDKKERRHSAQFCEQRDLRRHEFHDSNTASHEDGLIKSKSRALKIYNNLKKVKQPISPGGRLTNFFNSLFTPANTKKSKSGQASNSASACSSASSFSRSCLTKTSSSSSSRHQKSLNGVKRSVRFYPVSVIVDEESRPCGHKFLDEQSLMMPVSVPTAWKIRRSPTRKKAEVEEAGTEFLKEYLRNQNQNQKKSDFILMDLPTIRTNEYEEDDDASSCSSSDLFELDHLAVMENSRYCQDLPVYETTHLSTNRAIANGLII